MKKSLSLCLILALAFTLPCFALADSVAAQRGAFPVVTSPITLTVAIQPNANCTDYDDNYLTNYIEEKTGVTIQWYYLPSTTTEACQKIDLMVASQQELPDIIMGVNLTTAARLSYGAQGILVPLNEYLENEAYYLNLGFENWSDDAERDAVMMYATTADGNIYSFPFFYKDPSDVYCRGLWVNKVWLDKLGLDEPTTTDELYDVLVAFRDQDPNGNGLKDEIPLIGTTGWSGDPVQILINSFIYYSDYYLNAEDGEISAPFIQDAFRDALRYVRMLVNEGLLSPLSFTQGNNELKAILENGDADTIVGAFSVHPGVCTNYPTSTKRMEYDGIAPVSGPEGVAYSYADVITGKNTVFITGDCDDPLAAFRFLDALCDTDIALSIRMGQKGVDWDYAGENAVGKLEAQGYGAVYVTEDSVWAGTNNVIWHANDCAFMPPRLFGGMAYTDTFAQSSEAVQYNQKNWFDCLSKRYGKSPAEKVGNLIFTESELLEINEVWSAIKSYVDESVTRFVTGDMDIENDWNAYLANLESMQLSRFMEVAQEAYDRMK